MFTCRRVAVFVVLSSAFSILSVPSGVGGPVALAADSAEAPEFKRDSAAKSFESGLKSFKRRDYEGARTDFKKARSGAKKREDRAIVDRWIKATHGGEELRRVRRFVMTARHREAYDSLTKVYAEYLGTPIASEYQKDWKKLASRVATVVEGFDSHSRYYVKKPDRTFVEGEGVLRGTRCLQWKSSADKKTRTVALRKVPDNWSEYEEVELWYNARKAPPDMHLVLTCGQRGQAKEKDAGEHKLTTHIRMKGKGWQCLRLPLDKFTSSGRPCLTKIKNVELSIQGDRRFDFMLDSISLVKSTKEVARK